MMSLSPINKKNVYIYRVLPQKIRKVVDSSHCIGMFVAQSALITGHSLTVQRLCFTILALSIQ